MPGENSEVLTLPQTDGNGEIRTFPLPSSVSPIGTGELPQRITAEQGRRENDQAIQRMRELIRSQRTNEFLRGTIIENLPDEILNNETFLDLAINEHRQALHTQKIILNQMAVPVTDHEILIITLPDSVRRALADIDKNGKYFELAKELFRDPLTGLRNRAYYQGPLRDKVEIAIEGHEEVAEAAIDIDFFKQINDTYGHEMGDRVLKKVAIMLDGLRDNFREGSYFVSRIGGDEMRISFIGIPKERVIAILKAIRDLTEQELRGVDVGGNSHVSFSVGVSFGNERDLLDHNVLGAEADVAAYESKKQGKNTYNIFRDNVSTLNLPDKIAEELQKARTTLAASQQNR